MTTPQALLPRSLANLVTPEMLPHLYTDNGTYFYLPPTTDTVKLFDQFSPKLLTEIMSIEGGKYKYMFLIPILKDYFMPYFLARKKPSNYELETLRSLPDINEVLRGTVKQLLWCLYFATGSVQTSLSPVMRATVRGFKTLGFVWKDLRHTLGTTPYFDSQRPNRLKNMLPVYMMAQCFAVNILDMAGNIKVGCALSQMIKQNSVPEVLMNPSEFTCLQIFFAVFEYYPTSIQLNGQKNEDNSSAPLPGSLVVPTVRQIDIVVPPFNPIQPRKSIVHVPREPVDYSPSSHVDALPNFFHFMSSPSRNTVEGYVPHSRPRPDFSHLAIAQLPRYQVEAPPSYLCTSNSTNMGEPKRVDWSVTIPATKTVQTQPIPQVQFVEEEILDMVYFPEGLAEIQARIDESAVFSVFPTIINRSASNLYEALPESIRSHIFMNEKGQYFYLPPSDGIRLFDRIGREAVIDIMKLAEPNHPHLFSIALTRDYLLPGILGDVEAHANLGNLPSIYDCLRPVIRRLLWAVYLSTGFVQKNRSPLLRKIKIFFAKFGLAWGKLRAELGNCLAFESNREFEVREIFGTYFVAIWWDIDVRSIALATEKQSKLSNAILMGFYPRQLLEAKFPSSAEIFFSIEGKCPTMYEHELPGQLLKRVRTAVSEEPSKKRKLDNEGPIMAIVIDTVDEGIIVVENGEE